MTKNLYGLKDKLNQFKVRLINEVKGQVRWEKCAMSDLFYKCGEKVWRNQ